jgi:hypothetical protein
MRDKHAKKEIETMANEISTIHEDEALQAVGPDATAMFDGSASNPAAHASSENLITAADDPDEDEDEDDFDEDDGEDEILDGDEEEEDFDEDEDDDDADRGVVDSEV